MQTIDTNAILLAVAGLVFIYLIAAMIVVDGWVLYRLLVGRSVLPPPVLVPRRAVPWGAWTVLLLTILNHLVLPLIAISAYAKANGLLPKRSAVVDPTPRVHAPAPAPAEKHPPQGRPAEPEAKSIEKQILPERPLRAENSSPSQPQPKEQPAKPPAALSLSSGLRPSLTERLSIQAVCSVVLLVLAPLILRMTSRSPFRDLGLSFNRWWLQAGVGIVAFLAIQPALMATQVAMTKIWENNPHPLLKMVTNEFSPGVPQLAILVAVIIAPIAEELIYRGVIQSWLVKCAAPAVSGVSSFISRRAIHRSLAGQCQRHPGETPLLPPETLAHSSGIHVSTPELIDSNAKLPEDEADLAAPIESPAQPDQPPATNTPVERRGAALVGIIITSLIFAALHFDQWPAPIALFLLSVVIGYVYERTGSLLAAICMHAAFNAFSTFFLLSSLLLPQSAQHPELGKLKKPAAVAENSRRHDGACIHLGNRETTTRFL
jgi:membrane protease YdiL (CAAX protease family)